MSIRIGSLFSGYGGLDMGVTAAIGGTVAWHVENAAAPAAILAHNYPDVPNYSDVTAVDWTAVEPVDVLTGGFPCQDVSQAGRRAGLVRAGAGRTRSGLWGAMATAIEQLRPRLVIAENVRGITSATADSNVEPCPWCVGDDTASAVRALGAVLGDLADIGYDAAWYGLTAASIGAPHSRFRVFIIAWPAADTGRVGPDQLQAQRQQSSCPQPAGNGAQGRAGLNLLPTPVVNDMGAGKTPQEWDTWTQRLKDTGAANGNGHGNSLAVEAQRLLPTPDAALGRRGGPQDPDKRRAGGHSVSLADATSVLPTPRASDDTALLPTPLTTDWKTWAPADANRDTPQLRALPALLPDAGARFGKYAQAVARWETVQGVPAPDPTIIGRNGRPRLNPAFVEWMMGVPAGHVTGAPISHNRMLEALGNGVVPQQAEAAVRYLLAAVAGTESGQQ